ncbi:type VI secretion system tube protein TssD [Spirosoma aerolatum]|uniref:type VI secretion system tube protein TssD n=1 Tax=Spirosoma aerolatum TaxID=1211326 RepID=UPI0009ABF732|nr:type VI secretion system tube protein TssD [Spirosoma aerolatum]
MASFNAKLEIDGVSDPIELRKVYVTCHRKRDTKGRPSSAARWVIAVAIDTDEDGTFTEWMVSPTMAKNVTIKYYKIDEEGSVLKQWTMKDAHCYGMTEGFVADSSILMTTLVISGDEISNGNASLPHVWS